MKIKQWLEYQKKKRVKALIFTLSRYLTQTLPVVQEKRVTIPLFKKYPLTGHYFNLGQCDSEALIYNQ